LKPRGSKLIAQEGDGATSASLKKTENKKKASPNKPQLRLVEQTYAA